MWQTCTEFSPGLCYTTVLSNTLGNLCTISESLPSFYQPESVLQAGGAQGKSLGKLPRYQIKNDTRLQKIKKCPQLLFVYYPALLMCTGGWWEHPRSQDFREMRHWKASSQIAVCLGMELFIPLGTGTTLMPSSSPSGKIHKIRHIR